MEEVTYSGLVDRICRKIMIDETTTKLKLNYIPLVMNPRKPSYILEDEDVLCYLMEVNKDHQCRSVLQVELIKDVEHNQGIEFALKYDRGNEVGVSTKKLLSSGRANAKVNVGNITLHSGEPSEQYELLDNVVITYGENVDNSGMAKDTEVTTAVEGYKYQKLAWEDGFDVKVGQ